MKCLQVKKMWKAGLMSVMLAFAFGPSGVKPEFGIKHFVNSKIPVFALFVSLAFGPSVPKKPIACKKSATKCSLVDPYDSFKFLILNLNINPTLLYLISLESGP